MNIQIQLKQPFYIWRTFTVHTVLLLYKLAETHIMPGTNCQTAGCAIHHEMQLDTTVFAIAEALFKKTAIIIAILGQKILHGQLSKAILSSMYNSDFEAVSWVLKKRMKKLKMKQGPFIDTVIIYLMLWIRFKKELVV